MIPIAQVRSTSLFVTYKLLSKKDVYVFRLHLLMLIVAVGLIGGRIQGTMPQITDKLYHIMLYPPLAEIELASHLS